jgi:hypothetical protein
MKFIADVMLGRLGRWLRLLGYDTVIAPEVLSDTEILQRAIKEKRALLTRDKQLYQRARKKVRAHYFKSRGVKNELKEAVKAFRLRVSFPEKTRCSICNSSLKKRNDFWICSGCNQTYWKGTHWKRIRQTIREIKK